MLARLALLIGLAADLSPTSGRMYGHLSSHRSGSGWGVWSAEAVIPVCAVFVAVAAGAGYGPNRRFSFVDTPLRRVRQ